MKKLFVWLACVSICAAQAVSIGPFATEGWVEDRLQTLTNDLATVQYVDDLVSDVEDKIPDVSGLATKEYVNTTSNNLALLMDDLVSEDELGGSVSNIVPSWALVPVPPVTVEVDPAFTHWLATTNVVIDDNVGAFVSNVVPSWALVPVPPVTAEADPIFTAWEGSNLYVRTVHSGPVVLQNTLVVGTASVDQNVETAVAEGSSKAYANNSHAEGRETRTASNATFSHVEGQGSKTGGQYSHAAGYRALTAEGGGSGGAVVVNPHDYAWAWNGDYTIGDQAWYASHGPGTFNVNPKGGLDGFYIGTNKLSDLLSGGGGISTEIDPIFKSWADDNTNSLLKAEVDPAFTNWLATTNSATVQYVEAHKWDWYTQVTNAPSFVESEVDPAFTNWLATSNAVYRDLDGKWVDSSNTNIAVNPAHLLKYDAEGSGKIQTLAGDMLFYPDDVAVFLNGDDDGYLLKNTARDQIIDLSPLSVLGVIEDGIAVEGEIAASSGFIVYDYYCTNTTRYTSGEVTKGDAVKYHYTWPDKSGTIAIVEDLAGLASYQDVTNVVKAVTNLADRIVSGSNEAYVNSSGVYYKYPDGYTLPATLSFRADDPVKIGNNTFPSNYTVVINSPEVTSSQTPPVPVYGISTDGLWELETMAGDTTTGWINYIDGVSASPVFRITGFTGNNFSIVLDSSVLVAPDPNATLTRSAKSASDRLATELYVQDVNAQNAKPDIDYGNSALELSWGSGALQHAWLPYYNDPEQFPKNNSITTDDGSIGGQGATLTINQDGMATVYWHPGASQDPPPAWTKVIAYTNDLVGYFNENSQSITLGRRDSVSAVGHRSVCIGCDTNATIGAAGMFGVAVGQSISADGDYSLVRGRNAGTYSAYSTLIGHENSNTNSELSLIVGESISSYDSPRSVNLGIRNGMHGATNSFMYGYESSMYGSYSTGFGRHLNVTNNEAFVFGWGMSGTTTHGDGTFNINPAGGVAGVWIGETNLATIIQNAGGGQPTLSPDAIAPAWQQGSYTNGDFVIYNTHLYECTNMTSGAWTPTDWKQTSIAEMMGNLRKILDEINGEAL